MVNDKHKMINNLPCTPKSVDVLIKLLEDESHPIRFAAAEKLAEFGDISIDRLLEMLDEKKGPVKRYIIFALKKIGDPKVTDHFIKALEDEDWGVKLAALRSLGDLKDERAIEPIKKARRKGDKEFKKAANQALKKIQS